mmetsp:Transcript_9523/g.10527  ORF Transcript_9523/g.10527 Transcript_9523/m.10527 type:complete len:293 (+) Transcript_9523:32-910(+)
MANYFRDLGKKPQDLFKKNFPVDGTSFEVTTKTDGKVDFKAVGRRVAKDNAVSADLELSKKFSEHGIQVKGSAKTVKEFVGEVNCQPKAVKDLKLIVKAEHKKQALGIKVAAEYKHEVASIHTEASLSPSKGQHNFYAGIAFAYEAFTLGLDGNYKFGKKSAPGNYGAKLDYSAKSWSVTGFGRHELAKDESAKDKDVVGLNFLHKHSDAIHVAAEVEANVADNQLPVAVKFGGKYDLEDDSTIYAKFVSSGRFAVSWDQQVRKNLKMILAADVSLTDESHKYGCGFKFSTE